MTKLIQKSKAARRDDDVQIIRGHNGAPLYAVLAWSDYQRLTAVDGETAALIAAGVEGRNDETYPEEVARRLLSGEPALKVIREWRGLTQEELADQSHVATQYISQIERGVRNAGRNVGAKLAEVLNVSRDILMDV